MAAIITAPPGDFVTCEECWEDVYTVAVCPGCGQSFCTSEDYDCYTNHLEDNADCARAASIRHAVAGA